MYLIIDNTKNLSIAYMTPKLINILKEKNLQYLILSTRKEVNDLIINKNLCKKIKGIIISGGPLCLSNDVNICDINKNITIILSFPNIPILGICFGFQIMASIYGGKIIRMEKKRHGKSIIEIKSKSVLLNKNITIEEVFNCHKDKLIEVPPEFKVKAYNKKEDVIECIESIKLKRYGVQFHPEALDETKYIIINFINLCNN